MALSLLKAAIDTCRSEGPVSMLYKSLQHIRTKEVPAVRRYIRYAVRWFKYRTAAPKATQVLYIQPESVEYVVWPGFYSDLSREYTYIRNGAWDESIVQTETGHWDNPDQRSLIPLEMYTPYSSFIEHFKDGIPWEETEYFKEALSHPDRNRLGTVDSPRWEKFEEWDNLYNSLKNEGYIFEDKRHPGDEILIDIGRDGRLILDDGRHRLMIAKILGLDQIPVRVLVRHGQWQNKKRAFLSNDELNDSFDDLSDHPDL